MRLGLLKLRISFVLFLNSKTIQMCIRIESNKKHIFTKHPVLQNLKNLPCALQLIFKIYNRSGWPVYYSLIPSFLRSSHHHISSIYHSHIYFIYLMFYRQYKAVYGNIYNNINSSTLNLFCNLLFSLCLWLHL